MTTAAVILNWNRAALTGEAARSVRGQVDGLYLVDNDSAPDDAARVERLAGELDGVFLRLGGPGASSAGAAQVSGGGHTVKFGDAHFALRLIPSGILHPAKLCILGNGMVIDPEALLDEI